MIEQVVQTANKIALNGATDWQKVVTVESLSLTADSEVGVKIGTGADLANYQSSNGISAVNKRVKCRLQIWVILLFRLQPTLLPTE